MKKNLMTVVILALLVVNLALTGIVMFSTVSANRKVASLVGDIATVLNLELKGGIPKGQIASSVSIADTEVYNIGDSMTIALRPGADGMDHYALCSVSFSINKNDEDYKTYQPMLAEKESKIKSEIISVVGSFTKDEAVADTQKLEDAILARIQAMFDSKFIYEVYFRDIKYQ